MSINEITTPTAIATFEDRTGGNILENLNIAIDPVQDLHGYDSPWVGGAGKNKLNVTGTTQEISGVTFTVNSDGSVKANGTATANAVFYLNSSFEITDSQEYIFSGCTGGAAATYRMEAYYRNSSNTSLGTVVNYSGDTRFKLSDKANCVKINTFIIVVMSGATVNNVVFKPMVRLASVSDSSFAPYANICPITGFTEAKITRAGKNLLPNGLYNYETVYINNGITFTRNADGSVTTVGTASANTFYTLCNGYVFKAGSYRLSGGVSDNAIISLRLGTTGGTQVAGSSSLESATFTFAEDTACGAIIRIASGTTVNDTFYPMLRLTDSEPGYEPYYKTTYPISFSSAGTVYGGTLDVGTGVLSVDKATVDLGTLSWVYDSSVPRFYSQDLNSIIKKATNPDIEGEFYCSGYKRVSFTKLYNTQKEDGTIAESSAGAISIINRNYSAAQNFKTSLSGIQLVYTLETPTTYQLTSTQVTTILNQNNIWSDTGNINYLKGGYTFHDKLTFPVTQNDAINKINELVDDYKDVTNAGMMSYTDKTKLNNTNVFFGNCTTAASTAEKVVTLTNPTGFNLAPGTIIGVKFTNTNTASSVKLDVNNTGAKSIYQAGAVYTGTDQYITGRASYVTYYMYDGTYWVFFALDGYWGNTYDRTYLSNNGYTAKSAITAGNLIVADSTGTYFHLKSGAAFDITYPMLYAGSNCNAGAANDGGYLIVPLTITTTQSITLTANQDVYVKGTLSGTTFTPVSTAPLTQTVPTSADGYYYYYVGKATKSTVMYLYPYHPIYVYKNGSFGEISLSKMPVVTYGAEVVVANTTTVSFSKDGDNSWYISAENPISGLTTSSFAENRIYKVVWDGTTYDGLYYQKSSLFTGSSTYDWGSIGNINPLGYFNADRNTVPFCIEYDYKRNASEVQIISYDTVSTHTIKVSYVPFTKTIVNENLYMETHDGVPLVRNGSGTNSTIESLAKDASGTCSHAEGEGTLASATWSHAEGIATTASGNGAHAEGYGTVASGTCAHTEGNLTKASGYYAHAEGQMTEATGNMSHAEGNYCVASAGSAHAEGFHSVASGTRSHAEGDYTIANHKLQHVFGQYNIADPSTAATNAIGNYIEIVGNGTADNARSNARTLDWNGNEVLAGKLTVGAAPTNNMDVTTKQYVDSAVSGITHPVTGVKGNAESSYRTGNVNLTPANIGAVAKSGDTMTGQLKTSFRESVATGSYQAVSTNIPDLCNELRYSSGCMGSVSLSTSYTKDGVTLPAQWYNFLWIPHRSGGLNGTASGDNCNYGTLYLTGMTGSWGKLWILNYYNQTIQYLREATAGNVTGVKGNAETTYRTGNVNLTPANVGAVALTGNETVAGNKTFSGTTTLSAGSKFTAATGDAIVADSTAIIQSPIPKYLWHDVWANCRACTPTFYTTTDKTTWTQGTLNKTLFQHRQAITPVTIINATYAGARWQWVGGSLAWSGASWLVLGVTYSATPIKFDVLLEASDSSGDSATWTTLVDRTELSASAQPVWIKTNTPSVNNIRLTITRNDLSSGSTASFSLVSIMWITTRWGDQGKGSEWELPFSFDNDYNIAPLFNGKFIGDLTGNVNNHTVNSDVPANAVFTDTIRNRIYTATCTTGASTAAKVATLEESSGFSLETGVRVAVRFQYGNTATTPTLNVNSSGAKTIAYPTSATVVATGSGSTFNSWGAYETVLFTYNGTYWVKEATGLLAYLAYSRADDAKSIAQQAYAAIPAAGTAAILSTGTDTANRTWSAQILHNYIAGTSGNYGAGTDALLTAGTDTAERTWQAKILHDYMERVYATRTQVGNVISRVEELESQAGIVLPTTWSKPTVSNSCMTINAGGYYTEGRHCYVQMKCTMATGVSADSALTLATGMPVPLDVDEAPLSITVRSRTSASCYVKSTGDLAIVAGASTAISANHIIRINGVYTINAEANNVVPSAWLSNDAKTALLNTFEKVAYIDPNGQDYWDILYDSFYPPADLVSISAVYTQSGTVYDTATLDSLKPDLVVTGLYDDQSTRPITSYILTGTLTAGTSTITVSYGGKSTTFTVTVTHYDASIYSWDLTQSLTDTKQGLAVSTNGTFASGTGLSLDSDNMYAGFGDYELNRTYEFTITALNRSNTTSYRRFFMTYKTNNTSTYGNGLIFSSNKGGVQFYTGSWQTAIITTSNIADLDGKWAIYTGNDGKWKVYRNGTYVGQSTTAIAKNSDHTTVYIGSSAADYTRVKITSFKIYEGEVITN